MGSGTRLGLAGRVALRFAVVCAAAAGIAGIVAALFPADAVFAAALTGALALGLGGTAFALRPVRRTLQALRDGLLGYVERDFSLRITTGPKGDLGDAVRLFNQLGERLRADRNEVFQRQLLLETVLQSAPVATLLTDPGARVVYANKAARDMLNSGRKLDGHRMEEVLAQCTPALRDALAGPNDTLFTVELANEVETFQATRRYFLLNGQQHTLHMVNRLTKELSRQEVEVWKKVIRVMSHELNNSLAPILSLVHSARTVVKQPAHMHRIDPILDTIEDRAKHLRTFLEGYARFARLPRPTLAPAKWGPFLERVREMVPFTLPEAPPESDVLLDVAQMEQVFINLLKNAVEAGSEPAAIEVTVHRMPDGHMRVAVQDRGKGMNDEVLGKALLPFYSTKQTGTGLGLPLCREIVEAHGGTLRIANREGGGTVVTIWLPPA